MTTRRKMPEPAYGISIDRHDGALVRMDAYAHDLTIAALLASNLAADIPKLGQPQPRLGTTVLLWDLATDKILQSYPVNYSPALTPALKKGR